MSNIESIQSEIEKIIKEEKFRILLGINKNPEFLLKLLISLKNNKNSKDISEETKKLLSDAKLPYIYQDNCVVYNITSSGMLYVIDKGTGLFGGFGLIVLDLDFQ